MILEWLTLRNHRQFTSTLSNQIQTSDQTPETVEHLRQLCELISLWWTLPFIAVSAILCFQFGKIVRDANKKDTWEPHDYLNAGILCGFLAAITDNFYWGVAWTANFIESPNALLLFQWGCLSNIVCRQGLGLACAYFHIRALHDKLNKNNSIFLVFLWTTLVGLVLVVGLTMEYDIKLW